MEPETPEPTSAPCSPCPFCGSPAVVEPLVPGWRWMGVCQGAACGVSGVAAGSESEAAEKWNQRSAA